MRVLKNPAIGEEVTRYHLVEATEFKNQVFGSPWRNIKSYVKVSILKHSLIHFSLKIMTIRIWCKFFIMLAIKTSVGILGCIYAFTAAYAIWLKSNVHRLGSCCTLFASSYHTGCKIIFDNSRQSRGGTEIFIILR